MIAKSLAQHYHISYQHKAFMRAKYTRPQAKSNYRERINQMDDVFKQKHPIRTNHLLVIDDVYTTGATLKAFVKMLLAHTDNRIEHISVLTLCKA